MAAAKAKARPMTEREKARQWDAFMGRTPSKADVLWDAYEAAQKKAESAFEARKRAHALCEKTWDAQEAAYAAWKAESDREMAQARARVDGGAR